MKKFFSLFGLLILSILLVGISVLLFLTVGEDKLKSSVFWVAYSFTVPWTFLTSLAIVLWSNSKKGSGELTSPILYTLIWIFVGIYIIAGLLLIYLPIKNAGIVIGVEVVITVIYLVCAVYFVFGAKYFADDRKAVKQKVLFINILKSEVDLCALKTSDAVIMSALNKLSSDVRYSDPMSHSSLLGIENEISALLVEISNKLDNNQTEGVLELVEKTSNLLKLRNQRCLICK